MFDKLLRTLKQFEEPQQISISMQIESDADGYIDKLCPSQKCCFSFKVGEEDWRDKVRNEEVFCPFCGHTAPATEWYTPDQIEWAKQAAFAKFKGIIGDAMKQDASIWNRRQPSSSFLTITLQVKNAPQQMLLPIAATDPMRLKIACGSCGCRYSVIGSAYFCPACGHNSAEQVFDQSLGKIGAAIDAIPDIRAAIADRDVAENTVRLLIENGLQQAITAFQRFAEALFAKNPNAPHARQNVFQNLEEGSTLWESCYGKAYRDHLSGDELRVLAGFFQQRHLLAHREGLIDERYVARSGDVTYRAGQRLVIREPDVRECLDLIHKLGTGLRADAN
jgi:hypothetical protein